MTFQESFFSMIFHDRGNPGFNTIEYYLYFTFNRTNRKVMLHNRITTCDQFEKIDELGCKVIREISKDILYNLSADQFYLYQIVRSISSRKLLHGIEKTKPCPLNHS